MSKENGSDIGVCVDAKLSSHPDHCILRVGGGYGHELLVDKSTLLDRFSKQSNISRIRTGDVILLRPLPENGYQLDMVIKSELSPSFVESLGCTVEELRKYLES